MKDIYLCWKYFWLQEPASYSLQTILCPCTCPKGVSSSNPLKVNPYFKLHPHESPPSQGSIRESNYEKEINEEKNTV